MRIAPAIIVRAERDKTIDDVKDMYNNGYWIMDIG